MYVSSHQNPGRKHNTKILGKSLENVEKLKYMGTIVLNQNYIKGDVKRKLN
jgi:hypothetical protein